MTCKMMHQISYGFYLSIKKWSKLGQKSFWLILWVFLFMPSYTLWVTPTICQTRGLIKIYICGNFHHYSIGGCEVKDFWIDSTSMKWPLFRVFLVLTFSNIVQSCWHFNQRSSPRRQTQCLKNPSKFWILA